VLDLSRAGMRSFVAPWRAGRAASFLGWCARFISTHSNCMLRGQEGELHLQTGDRSFQQAPPKPFDSKLEARFARDLKKAAPDWIWCASPSPWRAAGTIMLSRLSFADATDSIPAGSFSWKFSASGRPSICGASCLCCEPRN